MAQIHFLPLDPLNFKAPEVWPRWKQCFKQFRVDSGLVDESAKKKVNTFTLLSWGTGRDRSSIHNHYGRTEEKL